MARHTEYTVMLAVHGVDVDPSTVTTALGLPLEPRHCHKRGDHFEVDGNLLERDAGCCIMWTKSSVPADADFETHAAWLLDRVEPHASLLTTWQERGWRVSLTIVMDTTRLIGGPTASATTMRRLAGLGVPTTWKASFAQGPNRRVGS